MGNEASQEGEEGATEAQRPPQLVSQQSMPLPAQASEPPKAPMGRRGSAGPQLMGRRPSGSGPPPGGPQLTEKRASIVEIPVVEMPDVDMTNLTEEEQRVIRSVMARAKSIEEEHPPLPKEEEVEKEVEKCSLCHTQPKECACVECGSQTCKNCSKAIPSGKKHVWMCGPCSERYPHLAPNISKKDLESTNEGPIEGKRRTSECPVPVSNDRRQKMGPHEGAPPQRGRSDSLPAQPMRQMQQQRPHAPQNGQMRHDNSQPRPMHPNNTTQIRGVRPDHPQQGPIMRPQQQVQLRPRHPVDQQKQQQMRPQHPMDQRPQHPMDQRPQHPMDQRQPHPIDQRPPHPMDQRPPHPMDQRPPHPMDQRPPHPMDQRPPHPMDQRAPHPMNQRPPHPMDPRYQHPMDQRPTHPMDQRPPHPMDQRPPHPMDQRPSQPMEQRPQQPMDAKNAKENQRRSHMDDQKLIQQNDKLLQQKSQHGVEQNRTSRPGEPRSQPTPEQRQHIIEQQRLQQEQMKSEHPADQQKAIHSLEQKKYQQPENTKVDYSTDQDANLSLPNQQRNQIPADGPLRNQHPKDNHQKRSECISDPSQSSNQKFHGPEDNGNCHSRGNHSIENGFEYPQAKTYFPNDQLLPRPQHPIVHPQKRPQQGPDKSPSFPPQDITQEYQPQRAAISLESNQITPPQRNQRLREPPEQQAIPRPQHPQQPPQEFPQHHTPDHQYIQDKSLHQQYPPDKHKEPQHPSNKNYQSHFKIMNDQSGKIQNSRNDENQVYLDNSNQQRIPDEKTRPIAATQMHPPNSSDIYQPNKCPQPQQRQHHNQQRNQNEGNQRQGSNQISNKHDLVGELNDVYVSLSEQKSMKGNVIVSGNSSPFDNEVESQSPPATLPRTKRPEAPQPAGRNIKREKVPPNQTLPRTGTNPFRTDTNPFRRESLPHEILDAGEYVTVAPRRGSLDERFRHMSNQDQARIVDAMKAGEVIMRPAAERRLEPQNSFEKTKNGSDECQSSNRYQDEEQRRNAINSGVCVPDPNIRRQLPNIDPQKRSHHSQQQEQSHSPPVPKARTSISDSTSLHNEGRNGIPRTVPLTSLAQTLEQQTDPRISGSRQQEGFNDYPNKNDKNFINDLSQHKQTNSPHGSMIQDPKRNEDYGHPNIIDTSASSIRPGDVTTKSKPPSTQPRQKMDRPREQPPYPPQVDRNNAYRGLGSGSLEEQGWRDGRRGKPLPPESNIQDLEGYQDEEEEQNIDDYFEMIEKAISRPQQQSIAGGKTSAEIQRQLLNQDIDRNHQMASNSDYAPAKGQVSSVLRQIDAFNQNQGVDSYQGKNIPPTKQYPTAYDHRNENIKEKNDLNMYEQDKILSSKKDFYEMDDEEYSRRDKKDQQYIIQPSEQKHPSQSADDYGKQKKDHPGKSYDKLLLHELTPDTRQPSVKHYLEEHKTQPLSYEAFSSVKAMQQMQPEPRREQQSVQPQKPYFQQGTESETRNQAPYYYSQQTGSGYYQGTGQNNSSAESNDASKNGQTQNGSKSPANDAQNQKKAKPKPDPQDWSPVSDLSPIIDVSPSVEAAEQELMEKFQEKIVIEDEDEDMLEDEDSRLLKAGGIPRATSGTISGMLEEFNRALGLPGTSPVDDSGIKSAVSPTSLAMSPISNMSVTSMTSVSSIQKEYQESFGSPQKSTPGGSPQKTPAQPTTPRRSHRRLPQPTVEQMQAAVAMAAQGPREKSPQPPSTTGQILFGVEPKSQSAASPSSSWKNQEIGQSFEQAYNNQQSTVVTSMANQSAVPSPAPRSQSRSTPNGQKTSDISQGVSNVTLQDVPTPQVRRLRSSSYGGSTSPKPTEELMARLNGGGSSGHGIMDMGAATLGSPQTPSTPRDRAGDSSDTQSEAESIKSVRLRRKLPNLPPDQCPSPSPTRKTMDRVKTDNGFQDNPENENSSLTPAPAMTVTTTVVTLIESAKEFSSSNSLGAPSPTPVGGNLSPLLGRRMETSRTPSPGVDTSGTKLPQYMQNLKQQLRDELKAVTEERKVMLEQRGKERGEGERAHTPQPPFSASQSTSDLSQTISTSASTPNVPKSLPSTNTAALSAVLLKQIQAQSAYQAQSVSQPQTQPQTSTPISYQAQQQKNQVQLQTSQNQTPTMSYGNRMPTQPQYQSQPQLLQYQNQPQIIQYQSQPQALQYQVQPQTPMKGQLSSHYGSSQELHMYQSMMDSGRRTPQPSPARTPLPDAVPKYAVTHRPSDDDITIMTTATTTVVSASEQWHDGAKRYRQPPMTTLAPSASFVGTSVESLRRLQQKMTPQASPKKGRRRHTSEITVPPFAQIEQAMHYQTMRQQQVPPPQYVQYYPKQMQQPPPPGFRSMDFPSIDSHARATDLLRSSSARFGGSLGSGFGSTEALYQGRRVLNNKLQDYFADNRMVEQQRVVGPDAYFQTLNNEINRLRRSSENIHRDAIYDKPTWGGPVGPPQTPVPEIRTSPQTTDRRKRKEKKSRKPRSWHPSPYVSEDEDDQMTREEKKAKIKAEIARRRQQIEENMRLHDELCKLAERRDRLEAGRTTPVAYVPSPTGSIAYCVTDQQPMRPSSRMSDSDDTSSVLKAIDEILRKDLYDRPLSRTGWSTSYNSADTRQTDYYQSGYVTMPRNRYEYGHPVDARGGGAWYEEEQQRQSQQQQQQQQQQYFQETTADPETAMDESIARIASTFPTDEPPDILLSSTPGHFSPETEVTPAMPLLPDMPTRSRKLLENLGSSPINPSRSGSVQSLYQDQDETNDDDSMGQRIQESSTLLRSQRKVSRAPVSKTSQKYDFPVKRILLTRDPKDRSVSGNGLGMKVVGGKEVPGSNGMIGAYVAKIFPGGVVETLGEVKEGDQVLEWNGIPLTGRTYEEVQRIIASSADEVEIVIRCDLNMLETLNRQRRSPGMGTSGGPRGGGGLEPPDTPGSGGPGRGGSPHSPYSPAGSSRGHSPALTKRTMGGGGGGGGNMVGNSIHIANNINHASSYEHIQSQGIHDSGFAPSYGRALISGSQASRSVMNVFAPNLASDWPELYEPSFFSSPPSPDDFIEDEFQSRWERESSVEQVQFQVCCGPRTAIVYVPIIQARPLLKSAPPVILNRNHFARRSVDHIDEYEPLLKNGWSTNERALGFYDLLRPRTSLGKVSLYLNGLKEKAEVYDRLRKTNGVCRVSEEREEEPRERPRAPSDLPGLRPVFVNDWKRPKVKMEENDDNNNTTNSNCNQNGMSAERAKKPHVGSSPEATTPYNILPKGCRGSFCVIL